jgi:DNA (cytosine-5)-methyltransferase 1
MKALRRQGRGPRIITLENVAGLISSNAGGDLERILRAFVDEGFAAGPMLLDAAWWTPQSRPRLMIVAAERALVARTPALTGDGPDAFAHPRRLVRAVERMPLEVRNGLVWWRLPAPAPRNVQLADVIEHPPVGTPWHAPGYTAALLDMMSPLNRAKLAQAASDGRPVVGCLFRRTRPLGAERIQRAEIRFDVAGCLRVATGGSSRQVVVIAEGGSIRSRLLSPREAARLMGLDDAFRLPTALNAALTVCGDGIAAPMVRHVARHVIDPLADAALSTRFDAA